jgi:hypothetical protein
VEKRDEGYQAFKKRNPDPKVAGIARLGRVSRDDLWRYRKDLLWPLNSTKISRLNQLLLNDPAAT